MNGIPVIAVVGPTASGKTSLSIKIAKYKNGEIISADSMQIYKNMSIASAAPTAEEKGSIKHHMFEFLPQNARFTVAQYVDMARDNINAVCSSGKLPIIVGGTGLYVDSLLNNISFKTEETEDTERVRRKLKTQYETLGGEKMLKMLGEFDPETAKKLHANDKKRILRAFEVYKIHNKTLTQLNIESKKTPSPYNVLFIGLRFVDREILYDRINKRVDIMLENGLLEEARKAYYNSMNSPYYSTAFQAIGHKEFFDYFNGTDSLENCVERLKMSTRRYAKRQMTWFNRNSEIHWIDVDLCDDTFIVAKNIIDECKF